MVFWVLYYDGKVENADFLVSIYGIKITKNFKKICKNAIIKLGILGAKYSKHNETAYMGGNDE